MCMSICVYMDAVLNSPPLVARVGRRVGIRASV